jgi:hypothetical protein
MSLMLARAVRRAAPLTIAIASFTQAIAPIARAEDPKVKCANAYEQAQRTRKKGELRASHAHLLVCTNPVCPSVLRDECLRWMDEVERAMPTVVFAVRDPAGQDITDVRVLVDGVLLAGKVDGKAHEIDPGSHTLRFESEGSIAVEQTVVIREGDKLRTLSVTLSSAAPNEDEPKKKKKLDDASPSRPVPTSVYVLGAIGIVGLGGFTYFGLEGKREKSKLDECKPGCDPVDVDHDKRTFLYSDISLGVGVVALGVATVLYFTRPEGETSSGSTTGVVPGIAKADGGYAATLVGRF